jgi:hypothetical protein
VNRVEHPGAGPGHALEESPAVNAVLVDVVLNKISHDVVSPSPGAGCKMLAARGLWDVRLELAVFIPSKRHIFISGNKKDVSAVSLSGD